MNSWPNSRDGERYSSTTDTRRVNHGTWFCLARRFEGRADDDAYFAGADPVGAVIGVAPERVDGKPAPVVGPHRGVNIVIAKGAVHIRPSAHPTGGEGGGGEKVAVLRVGRIRRNKIGKRPHGRFFAECVALALIGADEWDRAFGQADSRV